MQWTPWTFNSRYIVFQLLTLRAPTQACTAGILCPDPFCPRPHQAYPRDTTTFALPSLSSTKCTWAFWTASATLRNLWIISTNALVYAVGRSRCRSLHLTSTSCKRNTSNILTFLYRRRFDEVRLFVQNVFSKRHRCGRPPVDCNPRPSGWNGRRRPSVNAQVALGRLHHWSAYGRNYK